MLFILQYMHINDMGYRCSRRIWTLCLCVGNESNEFRINYSTDLLKNLLLAFRFIVNSMDLSTFIQVAYFYDLIKATHVAPFTNMV